MPKLKKITFIILGLIIFQVCNAHAFDGEVYWGHFSDNNYRAYPDGGESLTKFGIELGHRVDWYRPYL